MAFIFDDREPVKGVTSVSPNYWSANHSALGGTSFDPEKPYREQAPGSGLIDFLTGVVTGEEFKDDTNSFLDSIESGWGKFKKANKKKRVRQWEARQRRKKKRVVKKPVASGGGSSAAIPASNAGSFASTISGDSALGAGLPNIAVPNVDKRVNQIVNSLLKADKLQRENALAGLRSQYQSAGEGIGRGGLAYDKIIRGLSAVTDVMGDRDVAAAKEAHNTIQGMAGGYDPAGSATAFQGAAEDVERDSAAMSEVTGAGRDQNLNKSFYNAMRGADRMRVNEELANLGREYRGAEAELRAEADARALEIPLKRLEIEKQLSDDAIKKSLAAFELAAARENILNTRLGRETGRAELGMKREQLNEAKRQAAFERRQARKQLIAKQQEWQKSDSGTKQSLINEVLYGKMMKMRKPVSYDATGKPVYSDVYEPTGPIPTSIGEAVAMLRNVGVGKGEAKRIAAQWWKHSVLAGGISGATGAASNVLGNFGGASS